MPACAKVGPVVERPAQLPAGFPLPPGTLLTSGQVPREGQLLIGGVVPHDLQEAAEFFTDELPSAGYELGFGDSEGNEAEAPFTGNGFRGKWRVNSIRDCGAAVRLTLVLIEQ